MQGRMVREVGWRSGATALCRAAHLPNHRPAIERPWIEQVRTARPLISIAFPGAGNVALCRGDRRWGGFDRDQEFGVFAFHAENGFCASRPINAASSAFPEFSTSVARHPSAPAA